MMFSISIKFTDSSSRSDYSLRIKSFCMYYDTLSFIDMNGNVHLEDYDSILSFSIFEHSDSFRVESDK